MAMQVGDRIAFARAVENLARVVFQGVVNGDDGVVADGHDATGRATYFSFYG